jgi:hypothetical protein
MYLDFEPYRNRDAVLHSVESAGYGRRLSNRLPGSQKVSDLTLDELTAVAFSSIVKAQSRTLGNHENPHS